MRTLAAAALGAAVMAIVLAVWASTAFAEDPAPDPAPALVAGKSAEEWQGEYLRMRRLAYLRLRRNAHLSNQLRRTYWYPQQLETACVVVTGRTSHPACSRADGIIRCESVGSRYRVPNPNAKNKTSTASGYGQWLDTTWAKTLFGRAGISVFNGFANVLAVVQWVYRGGAYVHWLASAGCWG